jgi:hypothetical protein
VLLLPVVIESRVPLLVGSLHFAYSLNFKGLYICVYIPPGKLKLEHFDNTSSSFRGGLGAVFLPWKHQWQFS